MVHSRRKKRRSGHIGTSVGVIQISRRGYGFVDTPEGEYFVTRGYLRGAMDGDLVEVVHMRRLEEHRKRQMKRQNDKTPRVGGGGVTDDGCHHSMLGGVQRVLERAHTTIVGTVNYRDGLGVVHPADECIGHDIFIDSRAAGKSAQDGDVVVVRLTTYPSRLEAAQGYIEEVLGHHDEQGMDIAMVIRKHGLATVFSAAALEEAAALMAKAKAGDSGIGPETPELPRRDLRGRLIFTIDPVDARDFDDALSVDFIDGQMLLGVHIADVSAYVPWDSSLDLDARRRATSVYLPDRVLPMLPPQISDELCSLRPAEDKLAFTVDLLMRSDDTVASYDIYPSLIRSRLRLSYDEVQRFLDGDTPAALLSDSELQSRLLALNRLARKLARRREARGAIDFESTEAKLTLDEQGKPTSVYLRRKNAATALVEEAMILTNEVVAGHMLERKAPMVYRVHEEPFQAALDQLLPTLQEFDYADQGAPQTAFDIQHILALSRDHPEHALISQLLLRAMKRAKYAPVFSAHFGLAAKAYTHFTSPIRRYPDLLAHRLLKLQLLTKQAASAPSPSLAAMIAQLPWLCEHSSDMEREAEQASLEVTAVKLCEYLVPRVGEQFSGIISGINTYGFYVREDSTTAEGFVSRESLSESMHYEESRHRYSGVISDQVYRLGQHVQVILKDVDLSRAMLEFVVVK